VQCQTDKDVRYLFADRRVVTTTAVASFVGIGQDATRAWAWALRIPRIRGAFAWTRDDVDRLVAYLKSGQDAHVDAAPDDHSLAEPVRAAWPM
jgi:hypothetical protein